MIIQKTHLIQRKKKDKLYAYLLFVSNTIEMKTTRLDESQEKKANKSEYKFSSEILTIHFPGANTLKLAIKGNLYVLYICAISNWYCWDYTKLV